jgi:hypothetical protein
MVQRMLDQHRLIFRCLIYRPVTINFNFKEIYMKKLLSLVLMVFAFSFVIVGCKDCGKPADKPAVTDDKPADTETAKPAEETK